MAITCPSLPGSRVPSRRSTPAIAAAFLVSPARASSAVSPAVMSWRRIAGNVSIRSIPSVAKANGTPALARAAAVATCSFHFALRWASTRSGSSRSAAAFLRYSCSVGTLGSSGKLSRSTTGTLADLRRSATLAASRPPTITAVVPNSSARSSARWISSRVLLPTRPPASWPARPGVPSGPGRTAAWRRHVLR